MCFWIGVLASIRSIQSNWIVCEIEFSVAGAKDDRRDARAAADGLRTDRHLFRRLQIADPHIVELREWSRLAEELQQERVRLGNRLHHQLWRYYPQMLELTDDMAADWMLELWGKAPTPDRTKYLRKDGRRAIAQTVSDPSRRCRNGACHLTSACHQSG